MTNELRTRSEFGFDIEFRLFRFARYYEIDFLQRLSITSNTSQLNSSPLIEDWWNDVCCLDMF